MSYSRLTFDSQQDIRYRIYTNLVHTLFEVFLGPKNRVHIRIDGALDTRAKSETTISLSVRSL